MNLLDLAIFEWFNSWALWRPWMDTLIVFRAAFLGYWILVGLFTFGILTIPPLVTVFQSFRLFRRRNWEMISVALAAALVSRFGVVELIRYVYDRPRPFEVLSDLNLLVHHNGGGSFPSGHAAFFFAIAAVISRYYPKISLLFFGAAISLSFNRVAAGLHWPTDILGGAVIGIAVGLIVHRIAQKFRKPKPAA